MQWIDMHCDTLSELHRQNLQKNIGKHAGLDQKKTTFHKSPPLSLYETQYFPGRGLHTAGEGGKFFIARPFSIAISGPAGERTKNRPGEP